MKISSSTMLDMLRERGLPVDHDSQVVRFPKSCIEESLAAIPRKFEVFDRRGNSAFVLGDRQPKIAAGHNAVFWVDSESGQTRASTVADVENFAKICDQCNVIDMIGIPVMPQDVPDPKVSLLYGVRALLKTAQNRFTFLRITPESIEPASIYFRLFSREIYERKFTASVSYLLQVRFSGKGVSLTQ